MLGCVEYSVEYIRLWNLVRRCEGCRKFRELAVRGVEVRIAVEGSKLKIRRRRVGNAKPCIEECSRFTAEEKMMYDVLRFQELKEAYEPQEIDYSEENARERAWMRIELNSFV